MEPAESSRKRARSAAAESSRKRARSVAAAAASTPSSLLLFYFHHWSDSYCYSAYVLKNDAAADGGKIQPLPEPIFQFTHYNFPHLVGFAALGSKIYMIGGTYSPLALRHNPSLEMYSLDTYVFDTTKPLPPPPAIHDPNSFLIKGPRLNAPKYYPITIVYDGKIYVFARTFSRRHSPRPICEVLDHGKWVPLPDPPLLDEGEKIGSPTPRTNYSVDAYAVHDGIFVASTPKGIYCLNLKDPTGWKHSLQLGGIHRLPFDGAGFFINDSFFGIFLRESKHFLCKYDFNSKKGLSEEESVVLEAGDLDLPCYRSHNVAYLGNNRLCAVLTGLDEPPAMFDPTNFSNYICCNIFEVEEHQQKKKKKEKEKKKKKVMEDQQKKKRNRSRLVQHTCSRFIMEDNPGKNGYPLACFPYDG